MCVLCICVYTNICIYTCTHIHTYISTHICCVYVYHIHACVYVFIGVYVHVYILHSANTWDSPSLGKSGVLHISFACVRQLRIKKPSKKAGVTCTLVTPAPRRHSQGEPWALGQPGLHSEILSIKKEEKKANNKNEKESYPTLIASSSPVSFWL